MSRRFAKLLAPAALLALSACTLAPPVAPLEQRSDVPLTLRKDSVAGALLSGLVTAPAVAVGGGNLIGNATGSLIGNATGSLIGNATGAFGPRFGLLAASDGEVPVVGAAVIVRDARTLKRITSVPILKTDAQGRFSVPNLPAGANFFVEAIGVAESGKGVRLAGLARSAHERRDAALGQGSTLATARLMKEARLAGDTGRIYVLDDAKLAALAETVRAALGRASEAQRAEAAAALYVPVSGGAIDAPWKYEPAAFDAAERAMGAMASDAAVVAEMAGLRTALAAPLSEDEQRLVHEVASAIDGTPFAPAPGAGGTVAPGAKATPVPTPGAGSTITQLTAVDFKFTSVVPAGLRNVAAATVSVSGSPTIDRETGAASDAFVAFDGGTVFSRPSLAANQRSPFGAGTIWGQSAFGQEHAVSGLFLGSFATTRADGRVARLVMGLVLPDGRKVNVFDIPELELTKTFADKKVGYITLTPAIRAKAVYAYVTPIDGEDMSLTDMRALAP